MSRLASETSKLAKYGTVGVVSNLTLYVLFVVLIWAGVAAHWAVAICYVLGVAFSYTLNRKWTFQSTAGHGRDVPKFIAAYGIGLIFTMAAITVLVQWMRPELAQIVNIGLTAGVIYICLRLFRFGDGTRAHAD